MLYIILLAIILVVLFGPSLWIRHVYKKYSFEIEDCPGTGAELAQHLLERAEIKDVEVICGSDVDYYDPDKKQIVLSTLVFEGKSITSIAVAAHETGHAMQHFYGYKPLKYRTLLTKTVNFIQKVLMNGLLIITTIATVFLHAPYYRFIIIFGLLTASMKVLLHLFTLPVELDASFKRALPILNNGYLPKQYQKAAKTLLTTAAFTYISQALADVINVLRWFMLYRK